MFSAQEKQLVHFSEIGKVASGLIHDLSNIFMAVSIGVQEIHTLSHTCPKNKDLKKSIEKLLSSLQQANTYFLFAQKHIQFIGLKESFCISEELQRVRQLLNFKMKANGIIYKQKCRKKLFLYGDVIKFYQIISNIVSNAIEACGATTQRTRCIEIKVTSRAKTVTICISDNGPGIPKEYQTKVFTPFFTTKKEGVGIGLSVVKSIMEKEFSGQILLCSTAKIGTVFKLVFPLDK